MDNLANNKQKTTQVSFNSLIRKLNDAWVTSIKPLFQPKIKEDQNPLQVIQQQLTAQVILDRFKQWMTESSEAHSCLYSLQKEFKDWEDRFQWEVFFADAFQKLKANIGDNLTSFLNEVAENKLPAEAQKPVSQLSILPKPINYDSNEKKKKIKALMSQQLKKLMEDFYKIKEEIDQYEKNVYKVNADDDIRSPETKDDKRNKQAVCVAKMMQQWSDYLQTNPRINTEQLKTLADLGFIFKLPAEELNPGPLLFAEMDIPAEEGVAEEKKSTDEEVREDQADRSESARDNLTKCIKHETAKQVAIIEINPFDRWKEIDRLNKCLKTATGLTEEEKGQLKKLIDEDNSLLAVQLNELAPQTAEQHSLLARYYLYRKLDDDDVMMMRWFGKCLNEPIKNAKISTTDSTISHYYTSLRTSFFDQYFPGLISCYLDKRPHAVFQLRAILVLGRHYFEPANHFAKLYKLLSDEWKNNPNSSDIPHYRYLQDLKDNLKGWLDSYRTLLSEVIQLDESFGDEAYFQSKRSDIEKLLADFYIIDKQLEQADNILGQVVHREFAGKIRGMVSTFVPKSKSFYENNKELLTPVAARKVPTPDAINNMIGRDKLVDPVLVAYPGLLPKPICKDQVLQDLIDSIAEWIPSGEQASQRRAERLRECREKVISAEARKRISCLLAKNQILLPLTTSLILEKFDDIGAMLDNMEQEQAVGEKKALLAQLQDLADFINHSSRHLPQFTASHSKEAFRDVEEPYVAANSPSFPLADLIDVAKLATESAAKGADTKDMINYFKNHLDPDRFFDHYEVQPTSVTRLMHDQCAYQLSKNFLVSMIKPKLVEIGKGFKTIFEGEKLIQQLQDLQELIDRLSTYNNLQLIKSREKTEEILAIEAEQTGGGADFDTLLATAKAIGNNPNDPTTCQAFFQFHFDHSKKAVLSLNALVETDFLADVPDSKLYSYHIQLAGHSISKHLEKIHDLLHAETLDIQALCQEMEAIHTLREQLISLRKILEANIEANRTDVSTGVEEAKREEKGEEEESLVCSFVRGQSSAGESQEVKEEDDKRVTIDVQQRQEELSLQNLSAISIPGNNPSDSKSSPPQPPSPQNCVPHPESLRRHSSSNGL